MKCLSAVTFTACNTRGIPGSREAEKIWEQKTEKYFGLILCKAWTSSWDITPVFHSLQFHGPRWAESTTW